MNNASEVESLFSHKASIWSDKYSGNGPLRYRLDAFKTELVRLVMPPAKILDFGCGTGNLAGYLSACGFAVSACDISAKMIERARESNPGISVDWEVLSADGKELPYPANVFDAIVASSTFEYLKDVAKTFVECRRILKPGGFLIATVPNSRSPIRRLEKLLGPVAQIAVKIPMLKQISKLDSYATYLRCSRNRMPLDDWFAIGNLADFAVVDESRSRAVGTALVFLRFRKTESKSTQKLDNQQT
jgi:ubiquinone/menaquinone biosynthesis C-methylase UbiE